MAFWEADNLRETAGGRWLSRPGTSATMQIRGVSTDTRTLRRSEVFVALRGDQFDGHDYLAEAARRGAAIAVVDRDVRAPAGCGVIRVDDTYTALSRLAARYRRTLAAEVIAITGSVGKTTTKHMLHSVLASQLRGSASPKSYNNHVGVPLSILAADPGDRYLIVEIGSNAPGEVGRLSRIVEPDVAVITHVAQAHLEGLGTLEGIAREKAGVLRHLKDDGLAIVNGDAPAISEHLKALRRVVRYGRAEQCDLRLTDCRATGDGLRVTVNKRAEFALPLLGAHNAINALGVIAVARHLNFSDEQIAAGFAGITPPPMRMELQRIDTGAVPITIINDAYNANPESARAALATLAAMDTDGGRRVAVLGDMAELGDQSPQLHRELGLSLADLPLDEIVLIGPMSLYTAEGLSRRGMTDSVHALGPWTNRTPEEVAELVRPGDVVLLKGSRMMALERLVGALENCRSSPA